MPHINIQVRVPMADTDGSGRIHFTAMLRYMDIAEHELIRSLGFPRATTFLDLAFPRVHASCDLHGPVRYDDRLTIRAEVEHIGRSSWNVAFTAFLLLPNETAVDEETIPVANGKLTIVAMDPVTERARPLPDNLRRALSDDSADS